MRGLLSLLISIAVLSAYAEEGDFFTGGSSSTELNCELSYNYQLRNVTQLNDGTLIHGNPSLGDLVYFNLESSYVQDQEGRYCFLNNVQQLVCGNTPSGDDDLFCYIDNTLTFAGSNHWWTCPTTNGNVITRTKTSLDCTSELLVIEKYTPPQCDSSRVGQFNIQNVSIDNGQLRYDAAATKAVFSLNNGQLVDSNGLTCFISSDNQLVCDQNDHSDAALFCINNNRTLAYGLKERWAKCEGANGVFNIYNHLYTNVCTWLPSLVIADVDTTDPFGNAFSFAISFGRPLSASDITDFINWFTAQATISPSRMRNIPSQKRQANSYTFQLAEASRPQLTGQEAFDMIAALVARNPNAFPGAAITAMAKADSPTAEVTSITSSLASFCDDLTITAVAKNVLTYNWTVSPPIAGLKLSDYTGEQLIVDRTLLVPGTFFFTLTASDRYGFQSTGHVTAVYTLPKISAVVAGSQSDISVTRDQSIDLGAVIEGCYPASLSFQWSSNVSSLTFPSGMVQQIAPFTLTAPSSGSLTLTVSLNGKVVQSSTSVVRITVQLKPPTVLITQGDGLRSGTGNTLALDARSSIDNESPALSYNSMSYVWSCASASGCPDMTSATSVDLSLAPGSLAAGIYVFTVTAATIANPSLTGKSSIEVTVVAGAVPVVFIPALPVVDSQSLVIVSGSTDDYSNVMLWTIEGVTDRAENLASRTDRAQLLINGGVLKQCGNYTVTLRVTNPTTAAYGLASGLLRTGCPPVGGAITVHPTITADSTFGQAITVSTTPFTSRGDGVLDYKWSWWTDPLQVKYITTNQLFFTQEFYTTGNSTVHVRLTVSDQSNGVARVDYSFVLGAFKTADFSAYASSRLDSLDNIGAVMSNIATGNFKLTPAQERDLREQAVSNLLKSDQVITDSGAATNLFNVLDVALGSNVVLSPAAYEAANAKIVQTLGGQTGRISDSLIATAFRIISQKSRNSGSTVGTLRKAGDLRIKSTSTSSDTVNSYAGAESLLTGLLQNKTCGEKILSLSNEVMTLRVYRDLEVDRSISSTGVFSSDLANPGLKDGVTCFGVKFAAFEWDLNNDRTVPSIYGNNGTRVYSLSIDGKTVSGLKTPVSLTIPLSPMDENYSAADLFCQHRASGDYEWSRDSTCNVTQVSLTSITVVTSHLTQFIVRQQNLIDPPVRAFEPPTEVLYHTPYTGSLTPSFLATALGTALNETSTRFWIRSIIDMTVGTRKVYEVDLVITDPYQNRGNNSQKVVTNLINAVSQTPAILEAQGITPASYITSISVSKSFQPTFLPFSPVTITTQSAGLFTLGWSYPTYASYCRALNMNFQRWDISSTTQFICRMASETDRQVECVALPGQTMNMSLSLVCTSLESAPITTSNYYVPVLKAAQPTGVAVNAESTGVTLTWASSGTNCVDAGTIFSSWQITVVTAGVTSTYTTTDFSPFSYTLSGGLVPGKISDISVSQICAIAYKSSDATHVSYTAPTVSMSLPGPTKVFASLDSSLSNGRVTVQVTPNAIGCNFIGASVTFSSWILESTTNGRDFSGISCPPSATDANVMVCQMSSNTTYVYRAKARCSDNTISNSTVSNSVTTLSTDMRFATFQELEDNSGILSSTFDIFVVTSPTSFNSTMNTLGLATKFVEGSELSPNVPDGYTTTALNFILTPVIESGLAPSTQLAGPTTLSFSYAELNMTADMARNLVLYYFDESTTSYKLASSSCPPSQRLSLVDNTTQTWSVNTCHMTAFRAFVAPESPVDNGNEVSTTSTSKGGLSGGGIAGIVIGVILGVLLIVFIIFIVMKKRANSEGGGSASSSKSVFEPNHLAGPSRSPLFEPNHMAGVQNQPETMRPASGRL